MLDIASGLTEGRYATSRDQSMIAWLEGDLYARNNIKLMDIMTGSTQTISAAEGTVLLLCVGAVLFHRRKRTDNKT